MFKISQKLSLFVIDGLDITKACRQYSKCFMRYLGCSYVAVKGDIAQTARQETWQTCRRQHQLNGIEAEYNTSTFPMNGKQIFTGLDHKNIHLVVIDDR